MSYRITAAEITSFKRLKHVKIEPSAESTIVLIGGKNTQGKSSLLDAFTAALGGKTAAPADPVHHGEDEGSVRIELAPDSDEQLALIVSRTFSTDGSSTLEVREDGVKARSPQQLLDKIVGARFLDPLAFLAEKPGEQRAKLLEVVGNAERLADLDKKRQRAFDKRTEVSRDLKRSEAQLAGLPEVEQVEPVDVVALTSELREIESGIRARADALAHSERLEEACARAWDNVNRIRDQLRAAELEAEAATSAKAEAEIAYNALPSTMRQERRAGEINRQIEAAQEINRKAATAAASKERRAELDAEIAKMTAEVATCHAAIEEIDTRKRTILADAKLPVEGLGIDENGVTYNGVPLSQASGAERHRVALGIAIAASPQLRDVWIKDGSLLDDDSLEIVEQVCEKAGVRCWIERVGAADPGAIIISDGKIIDAADGPPPKKIKAKK